MRAQMSLQPAPSYARAKRKFYANSFFQPSNLTLARFRSIQTLPALFVRFVRPIPGHTSSWRAAAKSRRGGLRAGSRGSQIRVLLLWFLCEFCTFFSTVAHTSMLKSVIVTRNMILMRDGACRASGFGLCCGWDGWLSNHANSTIIMFH